MRSKWGWAALALVAVLGITTAASATTRGLITGKQIAPHSINSKHLTNHTIQAHDLSAALIKSLHGAKGATGQAGPQGAIGPAGAIGPHGPQGPPGLTNAVERYFARDLADPGSWLPIVSGTWPNVDPTHVLTMHLDKGNWAVTAEVVASNYAGQGIVVCLLGNNDFITVGQSGVGNAGGFALQQTFELQTIFPLDAPSDIELSCFNAPPNTPAGNPSIGYADVVATQVDNVSVSAEE